MAATPVNNGAPAAAMAPGAAAATNDEAGFGSFAEFEAQMAKDDLGTSSAVRQDDTAVRDASTISEAKAAPANERADDEGDDEETDDADDEATDDVEAAPEGEDEGDEEEAPSPAKGPQKVSLKARVGQLTRERHEAAARERAALERAEAAEDRARELEKAKPTAKAGPKTDQQAPVTDPDRPDPADFEFGEYDPEYQDALVAWRVEATLAKRDAKVAAKTQADEAKAVEAARTERWGGVIERGAAANADFEEKVLSGNTDWKLSKHMWELSVDSDNGHDVLYHLASNPAESARIFALPLTRQAVEFGKLEARFSQPSGESPKAGSKDGASRQMSAAPKPISQVRGAGGQFKQDAGTKDFAAFEAMMKAEEAARQKS